MTAAPPIAVEPNHREFTPTFAGFCMLLTYVVVVTNLLGDNSMHPATPAAGGPNTQSFDSIARRHTMNAYIDPNCSACVNFYDHACGQYLYQEPLTPWQASQQKMTNRLELTDDYLFCEANPAMWHTNNSIAQATIGFNITAADFPVRDWAVAKGFSVNGILVRLGILDSSGLYAPMLIADTNTDTENDTEATEGTCECLSMFNIVIMYGTEVDDLCQQLCTPAEGGIYTLKLPSDIPSNCAQAVKTFRMAASAPQIDASVVAQLETRFRAIELAGNVSGVAFHVGGGHGHIPDVPWHQNIVDTWVDYAHSWNTLWGQPIHNEAWPMSGWEANAFYTAEQHGIFLLAGVLVPPFYSPTYDNALLRGSIDFIMAHELGHAYDHLNNVSTTRRKLVDVLVRLSHNNPQAIQITEHEDYADRYAAQIISQMLPHNINLNLTSTIYQFAQMWCGCKNDTFDGHDVHAPSRWRVNQTVQQFPGWADTFC
jgi:hypothetical protein